MPRKFATHEPRANLAVTVLIEVRRKNFIDETFLGEAFDMHQKACHFCNLPPMASGVGRPPISFISHN